jgi:pyridinium-3,5-biscarboxylic acid mononucleotide sulfurtransferase
VDIHQKFSSLQSTLKKLGRAVVAYSGGVDSSFLLKVAVDTMGAENVIACIGISPSLAASQKATALKTAKTIEVAVRQIKLDELDDSQYSANKADRCFHCKSHLYCALGEIAKAEGIEHILCGSNLDDQDDFRPGNRAARDFSVRSPLAEASITKAEIRQLSKNLGLATADMPASPCLASRISYGLEVTAKRLKQVEQAEDFLRSLGFVEFRLRHHGDIARIEVVAEDIQKIVEDTSRAVIVERFKSLGFRFITVDMQGFRSGALNEALTEGEKRKVEGD